VGIADALRAEPVDDLVAAQEQRACALHDGLGILDVIAVPVGDQHVGGRHRVHVDGGGQRIAADEGIEQELVVPHAHARA
jgi:hypothetical protein